MNSKNSILILLLLGSLSANFYLFNKDIECPVACDNKDRFPHIEGVGAIGLTLTQGRELVDRYRTDYPPEQNNNHATGFVLTKRIFDEVFEDPRYNSLTLDMVTIADTLSLVVRGFKTDSTQIVGSTTDKVYVIKTFCPIDCSRW